MVCGALLNFLLFIYLQLELFTSFLYIHDRNILHDESTKHRKHELLVDINGYFCTWIIIWHSSRFAVDSLLNAIK